MSNVARQTLFAGGIYRFFGPGAHTEGETPVPIPNTEFISRHQNAGLHEGADGIAGLPVGE